MIAYVQNQENSPRFVFFDLRTRRLEIERSLIIESTIQLIRDFSCATASNSTRFSCVFISSGNFLSQHVFDFNEATVAARESQQLIYNPYKDFTAESVSLRGQFFVINGFSQNLRQNALLAYRLRTSGGSEWLYSGTPFSRFNGNNLQTVNYGIYNSPSGDKNLLFAMTPGSKILQFFLLGSIRIQPFVPLNNLTTLSLTFPESPAKTTVNVAEYFATVSNTTASVNSTSTNSTATASTTQTNSNLGTGTVLIIILLILLVILGSVMMIDYFKTGKFRVCIFFKKIFSKSSASRSKLKRGGVKLETTGWPEGMMDHSSDIGKESWNGISRF